MKMVLHIVGLRYYSWSGRMTELFDETAADKGTVVGQKLFLQRDYQCAEDAHAVMAWTLTEPVGHVAKVDLPLIAGVLDKGWKPIGLSNSEKGTLIDYIAETIDIRHKWKLFGTLWKVDSETLRTAKARGLDQDKTWKFRQRLDAL